MAAWQCFRARAHVPSGHAVRPAMRTGETRAHARKHCLFPRFVPHKSMSRNVLIPHQPFPNSPAHSSISIFCLLDTHSCFVKPARKMRLPRLRPLHFPRLPQNISTRTGRLIITSQLSSIRPRFPRSRLQKLSGVNLALNLPPQNLTALQSPHDLAKEKNPAFRPGHHSLAIRPQVELQQSKVI
jgi:hypothetical protein